MQLQNLDKTEEVPFLSKFKLRFCAFDNKF